MENPHGSTDALHSEALRVFSTTAGSLTFPEPPTLAASSSRKTLASSGKQAHSQMLYASSRALHKKYRRATPKQRVHAEYYELSNECRDDHMDHE